MTNHYRFGKEIPSQELTAESAAALCAEAQSLRDSIASYPIDKVLRLLGKVRQTWLNPDYAPRKELERDLPAVTGFSPSMVRKGLEELCWTFDPELLEKKLDTELRGRRLREGLTDKRWEPLGVVFHVLAGNVFVGAAGSLVEGMITRNVNILKMSSSEKIFLPRLVRSIKDLDDDGVVSNGIALVDFPSARKELITAFQKGTDGIVVWGGEQAVGGYRDGLPARSRLIVFGPKISAAFISAEGLKTVGPKEAARRLAKEISIWDQNACTAPQACYVEGRAAADALAGVLPNALDEIAASLPPGQIETDNAVEIQKMRSIAMIAEARGEGRLLESKHGLEWTVILDKDPALEPSPLHRTVRLVEVESAETVRESLAALRGYVQTVGVLAGRDERAELCSLFAKTGALRVVELGTMAEGAIDDPHDGRYDLPQYHHLSIVRQSFPEDWEPFSRLSAEERRELIDARLRRLIERARSAPFYEKRLQGLRIDSIADLQNIPPLTREEMDANMPPKGSGLQTGDWTGGYVTRSGGSTGEPKFSVYDKKDWDEMIGHAEALFRAMGLSAKDRLGNFMLAGDLYGSFVSFDHINARVGAAGFSFAGNSTPETFVSVWKGFSLNAVQGMPSTLVPFLRRAKELEPALTLQKLFYAGSPLFETDRSWLMEELKIERISSVIGANDGGQIGFQCSAMSGASHHTADDFNFLEILDEAGKPVFDGEGGELVLTSLLKHAFPLIRYKVGDRARILPGICPCGRPARRFELLGRADDMINIGMMNVSYRDFTAALSALPLSNVQLIARVGPSGETLIVKAENDHPSLELAQRAEAAILSSIIKIKERLDDKSLASLEISLVKPGELLRNPRTGKVKAVLDERA